MNTAEYLNTLIECKEDMKSAIIEKGVTPTGGLSTYADAIGNIHQEIFPVSTEIKLAYSTKSEFDLFEIGLNTAYYTDMSWMFCNCHNLKRVLNLNTSNVVNMQSMFENNHSLLEISLDTNNVVNMKDLFNDCQSLRYVRLSDAKNVEDVTDTFEGAALHNEITLDGFKDLGAKQNLIGTERMFGSTNNIYSNLTHDSKVLILNNLYDRASAGYSVLTLKLPIYDLTDEEISIATNKGWILKYD